MIRYPDILDLNEPPRRFRYGDRETILYALGIGLGADPVDRAELPFIYEGALRAVPTLATVVAWGAEVSEGRMGVNSRLVVHGEEETILHRPMPPRARLVAESAIVDVYDKGSGKGALVSLRTSLRDVADGQPIATINRLIFARGDGGCGGSDRPPPAPHRIPHRPRDHMIEITTRPDQAALYRLSGDRNPLHIDIEQAKSAGFERPILHGLCTYGIACRAVLRCWCDYDPARILSHAARFSAPVYPGETLAIDMWRDDDVISFEIRVPAREVTVVTNGKTVLRAQGRIS